MLEIDSDSADNKMEIISNGTDITIIGKGTGKWIVSGTSVFDSGAGDKDSLINPLFPGATVVGFEKVNS